MLEFARRYDPQPFHLDDEAARRSIYGGLIGSGWLTVAVMMRLLWETWLKDVRSLGSPGSDEIRWLKPVRPGDTLRARFTIVEAIPSRSKADRGVLRTFTEVLDQHGETVMTMRGLGMFGRRPPGPPSP
jgi:acyl dehydratase